MFIELKEVRIMSSLYFQICSTTYMILLMVVYFSKKKIMNIENKIYSALIITTFIGLILDYASTALALVDVTNPFVNLLCKLYLVYLLTWVFLFTIYTFVISFKNSKNIERVKEIFKKYVLPITISIFVIILALIFIFPLHNFSENGVVYTYGPSADLLYGVSTVAFVVMILCIIVKFKDVKSHKYLPMFAYIVLNIVAAIIQFSYPEILLVTSVTVFVTFFMYFTIENPDLKLINELNIARTQAEKANNAKTDFLSNMSHEIRTPLNAIVGFSQALLDEEIPDNAKEEVKDIIMASDSLLEIVNGILDISKIEANKLEIVNTEYSFEKVLKDLVSLTKGRMGDKPLEFRTDFDETIPPVLYGDYVRLKQIIINILTNSVKYTKEGYIEFKVSSVIKGDVCRLIFSVEDSGIGIKKDKIDKLFTKFERFDAEKNITIEGTGLGLAITKKLVELMNGQIVVQSVYGKGSKFTVAIDQKIVKNPATVMEQEKKQADGIEIDISDKKILVVDDNKINLKVAARLFQSYNVVIEQALSGQECIDKINNGEKYDLILLDDMMPKMSGIETLKILKQIDGYNIPTVAFTANAISGMKNKYLDEGFDDYLSKPIQKSELNDVLKKFLMND
jgi:signal transduction histidine kinase/CheY-like chemotaxis protein